jgi:thiosulfate reductase cytochrome b subunit
MSSDLRGSLLIAITLGVAGILVLWLPRAWWVLAYLILLVAASLFTVIALASRRPGFSQRLKRLWREVLDAIWTIG